MQDATERMYWIEIFKKHQPNLMEKAINSAQPQITSEEGKAETLARAEVSFWACFSLRLVLLSLFLLGTDASQNLCNTHHNLPNA